VVETAYRCVGMKKLMHKQLCFFFFVCEMNILFSHNLLIKKYPCVLQQFQLCVRTTSAGNATATSKSQMHLTLPN